MQTLVFADGLPGAVPCDGCGQVFASQAEMDVGHICPLRPHWFHVREPARAFGRSLELDRVVAEAAPTTEGLIVVICPDTTHVHAVFDGGDFGSPTEIWEHGPGSPEVEVVDGVEYRLCRHEIGEERPLGFLERMLEGLFEVLQSSGMLPPPSPVDHTVASEHAVGDAYDFTERDPDSLSFAGLQEFLGRMAEDGAARQRKILSMELYSMSIGPYSMNFDGPSMTVWGSGRFDPAMLADRDNGAQIVDDEHFETQAEYFLDRCWRNRGGKECGAPVDREGVGLCNRCKTEMAEEAGERGT